MVLLLQGDCEQTEDRLHRIGQKSEVNCLWLQVRLEGDRHKLGRWRLAACGLLFWRRRGKAGWFVVPVDVCDVCAVKATCLSTCRQSIRGLVHVRVRRCFCCKCWCNSDAIGPDA